MEEEALLSHYPKSVQQRCDTLVQERGIETALCQHKIYDRIDGQVAADLVAGLPLQLAPGWTFDDLALGLRLILSAVLPCAFEEVGSRPSNSEIREELREIHARITGLLDELRRDTAAIQVAKRVDANDDLAACRMALARTAIIFEVVSNQLSIEKGKWRNSAMTELRTRQAHYLTPLFEAAFGKGATVIDNEAAESLGAWPEFIGRLVHRLSGRGLANARAILKEARKRHLKSPIRYPPGFFDMA